MTPEMIYQNLLTLTERVAKLEAQNTILIRDNQNLKQAIVGMVMVDESFDTPYAPREIVQMLFDWANEG